MKRVAPEDVDIRLAVGEPRGETPIKMICPMHKERIGVADDKGSLAVYRKNLHCFGCGFHVTRRYASLAFLLGEWDGRGGEDRRQVREAVRRIKPRLGEFVGGKEQKRPAYVPPPIDPITVEAFHQYLLTYAKKRMVDELIEKRGLSLDTIRQYRLGHTGTHFTIPVPALDGSWYTLRYRADDTLADTRAADYRKYEGTWGRNAPTLFPLHCFRGLLEPSGRGCIEELWIVEGEFDAISSNQAGNTTLTITNGATNIVRIVELVGQQLPRLHVNRWVIATDQDGAGEQAAAQVMERLSESGQSSVRARWSGAKDLTEYYAGGGKRKRITYEEGVSRLVLANA